MPIKKDGSGRRWVEMEVLVPGTPEQVWQAIGTGPGYAAWFVKGEIEPRVGGRFALDFGQGAVTSGEVTVWDPPRKVGYVENEWQPGAPPVATEVTVIAHSGGRCVIRMVHSLFSSVDDWDDQLEGFENGWPGFFAILRVYLAHFPGARAGSFMVMAGSKDDPLSAWQRVADLLSLAGANAGERRTVSTGPEAWSGVVELVHQNLQQRYLILRLDAPSPGIALIGTSDPVDGSSSGATISLCRYFYGDDVEELASQAESAWQNWMAANFVPPPPAPPVDGG